MMEQDQIQFVNQLLVFFQNM